MRPTTSTHLRSKKRGKKKKKEGLCLANAKLHPDQFGLAYDDDDDDNILRIYGLLWERRTAKTG